MIKNIQRRPNEIHLDGALVMELRSKFSARYTNGNTSLASLVTRTVDALVKPPTEDEGERSHRYEVAAAVCIHFNYPAESIPDEKFREFYEKRKVSLDKHRSKQLSMELLCR